MNTCVIVQARMSSTRLPGKTLMKISGKPMLQHVIERLKRSKLSNSVIVATSDEKSDDAIEIFCKQNDYLFYRGSEKDVLDRYYQAAKIFNANQVVRITGDEPLVDPVTVDKIISVHLKGRYDYTRTLIDSNNPNSYPRGLDVDIMNFDVLEKVYHVAITDYEREHVTIHIYENPEKFNIKIVEAESILKRPNYRFCVDTASDLKLVRLLYSKLYTFNDIIDIREVIKIMDEDLYLRSINMNISQKDPHLL